MISFGALVAFSVVNLAVIGHYIFERESGVGDRESDLPRRRPEWFQYGILPGIGCVLTAWLWTSLSRESLTIGLEWLAAGAIYLGLRRRRGSMQEHRL